jgi:hypothetical protein
VPDLIDGLEFGAMLADKAFDANSCQSALNVDPLSASKTDPLFVRNWADAA